jgi:F420H(2)-dependent quinone reductase
MNLSNVAVYEASDGRVAGSIPSGVPIMLLTTIGCRTGRPFTASIVYLDGTLIERPGRYYVVGSNGGLSAAPAWIGNVRRNPSVRVDLGDDRFVGTASVVDDQQRASLVVAMLAKGYSPFRDYGTRAAASGRPIRVVEIAPRAPVTPAA